MSDIYLGGRRIKLNAARAIGSGGEADVFDIGSGLALKLYKGPEHTDYRGMPLEQRAARERLRSRPGKLRDFPSLPPRVISPLEVATDRAGAVVGYSMRLVPDSEPLLRWAEPGFRRAIPPALAAPLFLDIHATIARIHEVGVVIGDFNDLNVLVSSGLGFFIDADSFQFGPHECRAFTERFADPLCCRPGTLDLLAPFSNASDWYAFDVLLFQSLLLVHPYGGVLPGAAGRPCERIARRAVVFDPSVRYPKPALPWRVLPDELLERFHGTFVKDKRHPFPRALLENLRFTRCTDCQGVHARASCPFCGGCAPAAVTERVTVRGSLTATRLHRTEGEVVAISKDGWLVFERGEFRREDGTVALRGPLRPGTRYFLEGRKTVAVARNEAYSLCGATSWWERDGALWRDGTLGEERVGEVLAGQTRFWVGPEFGFGFYRAGGVTAAFSFEASRRGISDAIKLPPLRGRVLDADCVFGPGKAWLLLELESGGRVSRRCVVIRRDGTVAAAADNPAWLEGLRGACAAGDFLYVPSDRGIIRVDGSLTKSTEFPETEPFVSSESLLALGEDGLIASDRHEIVRLTLKKEATP